MKEGWIKWEIFFNKDEHKFNNFSDVYDVVSMTKEALGKRNVFKMTTDEILI